jgi:hypothetical protein
VGDEAARLRARRKDEDMPLPITFSDSISEVWAYHFLHVPRPAGSTWTT